MLHQWTPKYLQIKYSPVTNMVRGHAHMFITCFFQIPKNFHACPLRIICFRSEPFIIEMGNGQYDGIDFKLLQTISQKMNFTAIFRLNWILVLWDYTVDLNVNISFFRTLPGSNTSEIARIGGDDEFVYELISAMTDIVIGGWTPLVMFTKYLLDNSASYAQVTREGCKSILQRVHKLPNGNF